MRHTVVASMVGTAPRVLVAAVVLHLVLLGAVLVDAAHGQRSSPVRPAFRAIYEDSRNAPGPGADFFALYHAGESAAIARSVYSVEKGPTAAPYYYAYRYLPLTAQTLGRVLARLPPYGAYAIWLIVIELLLLLLLRTLWRVGRPGGVRTAAVCILLLSAPHWLELYMGQFTFAAAALAVVAVCAVMRGASWTGAVMWSVAGQVKVFPLILLPVLARYPGGLILGAAVCATLAIVNAPSLLGDASAGDAFWAKNFMGEPAGLESGNYSPLYAVYLLGIAAWGGWHLPSWGMFTLGWRILVLGAAVHRVITVKRPALEIAAALLLLAHFASYFQVWEHHMAAVIAVGALLAVALDNRDLHLAARTTLAALGALALPSPAVWLHGAAAVGLPALVVVLSKVAPVGVLLVIAATYAGAHSGERRRDPSATVVTTG